MNIFFLSKDPRQCAEWHTDRHVVKMILEYAQLLSSAHRFLDGTEVTNPEGTRRYPTRFKLDDTVMDGALYQAGWLKHPSSRWAQHSKQTYLWLFELFKELNLEYTYRYHRTHVTWTRLGNLLCSPPVNIPDIGWVQPYQAMHERFMVLASSLQAYRENYRFGKHHLATWTGRDPPPWLMSVPGMEIIELPPGKTRQRRIQVINDHIEIELTPSGRLRGLKPAA